MKQILCIEYIKGVRLAIMHLDVQAPSCRILGFRAMLYYSYQPIWIIASLTPILQILICL
jgi:hypothetical protein